MHAESQDPRFGSTFTNAITGDKVTGSADEAAHVAECLALMERLGGARGSGG